MARSLFYLYQQAKVTDNVRQKVFS